MSRLLFIIFPAPLWEEYRLVIIGIIAIIISEAALILGLAVNLRRRRKSERTLAERKLALNRDCLEKLLLKRTAEMKSALVTAETANRAKNDFLASMGHEIRTPMNAVLGFAQLLEHDASLSPQGYNRVKTIMKSGECLLSIINDILAISRIEAGRMELRTVAVELKPLVDDIAAMFRLRAEEKGISFSIDYAENLPRSIMADVGKLRQVLINIIGNAFKFTVCGFITIRTYPAGSNRIAIEIKDTGIGMRPEELENIFLPFVRLDSGRHIENGTGLGLSISREYASLMGGTITVDSKPDAGSCFRFEFNAPATTMETFFNTAKFNVVGLAPDQDNIRVLVVDDQSTNRELLRGMLERIGFVVDEATGGREALEKTRSQLPRIIIMDLVMPDLDGAETTRILRAAYPDESLTIIGISASIFDNEKNCFLSSGIDAFIAKPFREPELYGLMARHAGVKFITEAVESALTEGAGLPTMEKMTAEWLEKFRLALSRGNITHIRQLGEKARVLDPVFSAYLLNLAELYDLDALEKLISPGNPVGISPPD